MAVNVQAAEVADPAEVVAEVNTNIVEWENRLYGRFFFYIL
jgi:hypothetical protein